MNSKSTFDPSKAFHVCFLWMFHIYLFIFSSFGYNSVHTAYTHRRQQCYISHSLLCMFFSILRMHILKIFDLKMCPTLVTCLKISGDNQKSSNVELTIQWQQKRRRTNIQWSQKTKWVSWPSYFTELDCLKWSLMARCTATHSYRITIIRMLMSIKLSCMTYHRIGDNSNTTGAHIEILTLPEHLSSPSDFSRVRVARSLMFCVMFCRSLFILLSFLLWSLFCLSYLWLSIYAHKPSFYLHILLRVNAFSLSIWLQ